MNMVGRSSNHCCPRRPALTLVEVIVGLALLGGVVATSLVAVSRHLRQLRIAERKQASVRLIEQFLTRWSDRDFRLSSAEQLLAEVESAQMTNGETRSTDLPPIELALQSGPALEPLQGKIMRVIAADAKQGRVLAWADIAIPMNEQRTP